MLQSSFRLTLELRDNSLGQHLTQFDAPLIEGVNIPDRPLRENRVFVKGDEFAEDFRGKSLAKDRIRWTVALEYSSRHERIWCSFRLYFLRRFAEGQSFSLREHVGH